MKVETLAGWLIGASMLVLAFTFFASPTPKSPDPVKPGIGKLRADVDFLLENKVVLKFDVEYNQAWVDPDYWYASNIDTKKGIAQVLAQYCDYKESTGRCTIYDYISGRKLADYSSAWGFEVY